MVFTICNILREIEKYESKEYELLDNEEHQQVINELIQTAKSAIDMTIKDLCRTNSLISEVDDFFYFAYELRKHDTMNDSEEGFTEKLLKDKVKSKVILDIILSNRWNEASQEMEIDMSQHMFFIKSLGGQRLHYQAGSEDISLKEQSRMANNESDIFCFQLTERGIMIADREGRNLAAIRKDEREQVEIK